MLLVTDAGLDLATRVRDAPQEDLSGLMGVYYEVLQVGTGIPINVKGAVVLSLT